MLIFTHLLTSWPFVRLSTYRCSSQHRSCVHMGSTASQAAPLAWPRGALTKVVKPPQKELGQVWGHSGFGELKG